MSVVITGATIIDGLANEPLDGKSIWIEGTRIKAIGRRDELSVPAGATVIDGHGKYLIPGLMNANVHLFTATSLERLGRHMGHYEDIIIEAAQVALKSGLTTVFDTYGPRRYLMAARDMINEGKAEGSRIFCAGNIVGFDGPFSQDFDAKSGEVASAALAKRINSIWVENVGRHLMWLTPQQVGKEVRSYIGKGIDFIKYAANDHAPGAFIGFSPRTQGAIVEEAHRAGTTAQAHSMSVEGLWLALEAGCDLITHCNITGPTPIPEETLELFAKKQTGAVLFAYTQRRLEWFQDQAKSGLPDQAYTMFLASDINVRNLIRSGAPLLYANDGYIPGPEEALDPQAAKWFEIGEEDIYHLSGGHFNWFRAMEEKGCSPMTILRAATRNIAVAYGKDKDLGTLEPGKIADLLILDKNPLLAAGNYRSINTIIKDGEVVDRDALPLNPILTKPVDPAVEEEASYVPFLKSSHSK